MKLKRDHLKFQFFLLFLLSCSDHNTLTASSSRPTCLPDENSSLLKLKQSFSIEKKAQGRPKMKTWKPETDCCFWDGVTCDGVTGHVIGLDLSQAMLSGSIDSNNSLFHLSYLQRLNLAYTFFNYSQIPSEIGHLSRLTYLDLSMAGFSGQIPPSIGNLTQLVQLDLSGNNLTGPLPLLTPSSIKFIDISNNFFTGQIPTSFFSLPRLVELSFSSNNFSGTVDPNLFQNLKNLSLLDLSHNSLLSIKTSYSIPMLPNFEIFSMSSCNLTEFPIFLITQENLVKVDLSNNGIHGQIPKWIWETRLSELNLSHNLLTEFEQPHPDLSSSRLGILDLRSNKLRGSLPNFPPSVKFISVSNNEFSGEIPITICNVSHPLVYDLSDNQLPGLVPPCLGNFSNTLKVLNLRGNNFHGTMLQTFSSDCSLETLDFSENRLRGKIPRSLSNCTNLRVLNFGNNQINDSFPHFMGNLPKFLVLILHSNNFHGIIEPTTADMTFPSLHIIDLSGNHFTGILPREYFINCTAMENINEKLYKLHYMGTVYYDDSVSVTYKGTKIEFEKIITLFTSIDLSNNQFEGQIPEEIGSHTALRGLNLSHNAFVGSIPSSLGNLRALESLDLSQNMFSGEIPRQLNNLISLAVMNLSFNHLVGAIPKGHQLQTFSNNSYIGNPGLCGDPLSKNCNDDNATMPFHQQQLLGKSEHEFVLRVFLIGYGGGVVIGLVIGYVLFWRVGYCDLRTTKKRRNMRKK